MSPKPKNQDGRNERDEKAMQDALRKMQRKGADVSKMPGVAARDGRISNA